MGMLEGRTILITGGGSGIGEALAVELSAKNKVIICGRNVDKLERVSSSASNVSFFVADISQSAGVDRLFQQLANEGITLDVVFNNAGTIERYDALEGTIATARIFDSINTNLAGGISVIQRFLDQADRSKENIIVNITSEIALFPVPQLALYSASKTGFSIFTRVLRQQLKHSKFKVVEILPPHVETGMPKRIGNKAKGVEVHGFAKAIIQAINDGKEVLANGRNVPLLKMFNKFLPGAGLELIDRMSKKQLQNS
jgi:uncharacterized oxidoreductase